MDRQTEIILYQKRLKASQLFKMYLRELVEIEEIETRLKACEKGQKKDPEHA